MNHMIGYWRLGRVVMAVALGAIGRPRGFEPHSRQNFLIFATYFPNKFQCRDANTQRELQNKLGDSSKLEQLTLHRPFCAPDFNLA